MSYHFNGMQLVSASYVPKLKLPRPCASRVIAWRQVDALTAGSKEKGPGTSLCIGRCTWGLGAQRHPRLLFSQ